MNDDDAKLARSMERLSIDIRSLIGALSAQNMIVAPPCQLCLVCQSYHAGKFEPGCRTCIQNGWKDFRHVDAKVPFWKK